MVSVELKQQILSFSAVDTIVEDPPLPSNCSIELDNFDRFLSNLPSASVDLILTDPPYTISRKTGFANGGGINTIERFAVSMDFGEWDHKAEEIDLNKLCNESYRCLRKGGTAIIFFDIWKISYLSEAMASAGFKQIRLIIWEKTNPVPLNSKINYLTNAREIAVLGVKVSKPTFHSFYDTGVYSMPIHRDGGKRLHPTQKPLKLITAILLKHSNPKDFVVDPFLGSGTTALVCARNDRKFAGCDIDQKYVDIARKRLSGEGE